MSEDFLMAIIHGDYSEKEIRTAFSRISSPDLAKHLDSFIMFQGKAQTSRSLSRKWALSVAPEDLRDKLESFIKWQESEDEDVRGLASDLADKIDEDVLIENIASLIGYQELDDEDIRTLASDLALKIDPSKLTDKLDLIETFKKSNNQYVCALATKLIENINGGNDENKIQAIIDLVVFN